MLHFHRIDFLKVLVLINKAKVPKECLFSVDKGFRFQLAACNRCHDVSNLSVNINKITILNTNGIDYCCIIFGISIKMNKKHLLWSKQNNAKKICMKSLLFNDGKAKSKECHENNKERLQEEARNSCRYRFRGKKTKTKRI